MADGTGAKIMQITFNPNGGDLGRAKLGTISPVELYIVARHVAEILEALHSSEVSILPFKYAFEFITSSKDLALLTINATKLPPHVHFYECDGIKLFEIRGAGGGIVTSYICYLVTGGGNDNGPNLLRSLGENNDTK